MEFLPSLDHLIEPLPEILDPLMQKQQNRGQMLNIDRQMRYLNAQRPTRNLTFLSSNFIFSAEDVSTK